MQRFYFQEGSIEVPGQWMDESVQVLVSQDNSGINIVITRQVLPFGTETQALYESTLEQYRGMLAEYKEHRCETCALAGETAWLLDYAWKGPEGRIDQLSIFQRRDDQLLTFTVTASVPMSEGQKKAMLAILQSYQPPRSAEPDVIEGSVS